MRAPLRRHGRYASRSGMTTVKGQPGAPFELIVVDGEGRPVPCLTAWYRLHKQSGPNRTRDTYLGYLLPVFSFLQERQWSWDAPPATVRRSLLTFQQECLHLTTAPDHRQDGYILTATRDTPLSESGLRCLSAALADFYRVMAEAGLYAYANPLTSELLVRGARDRARLIENAGAPEHAGIRGESRTGAGRQPTAFFRTGHSGPWSPVRHIGLPAVLHGLQMALDAMINRPGLAAREKAVLLLLRYTGARVHEIVGMTVGGYRSHTRGGVVGQALVVNKGSQGRESKEINFAAVPQVHRALRRYLQKERPGDDPHGRTHLAQVGDDEPFFLARGGTPYTYWTFKYHWRRLYAAACTQCPVAFSPHDIRHLFITEWLLLAREHWGKESPSYADTKQAISTVMGWRSPATIDAYDHSLDEVAALALQAELQRRIAHHASSGHAAAPQKMSPAAAPDANVPPPRTADSDGGGSAHDVEHDALAWIAAQIHHS